MDERRRPTLISSVQRALRVLEVVAAHPGVVPAKQVAREADLPLATTYHLLRTLANEGYVIKLSDGGYVLGERVESLRAMGRPQLLLSRVRPTMVSLRDEIGAASYLGVYEDGEVRVLDIAEGPRAPRVDVWVGFEDSAHATALGKCILAQLDEETRDDYLARHPLVDLTPHTITEPREFVRRLGSSREICIDQEEYMVGTTCVAVPVGDGAVVGALAVSCRSTQFAKLQASAGRLRASAERISRTFSLTT